MDAVNNTYGSITSSQIFSWCANETGAPDLDTTLVDTDTYGEANQTLSELCSIVTNNRTQGVFEDDILPPRLEALLVASLGLMIVATVIGNILVCLSVVLVRKLRHPSNYLL
ncbi:unnamed protein product, partial [Medioppia subpectinata]